LCQGSGVASDRVALAALRRPRDPFVYVRFHGTTKKSGGSYPDAARRAWARRLRAAADSGRDVYAYCNNDIDGAAVANARTLIELATRPGPLPAR
jgi:uncharacterized protein YecE (DUF72 family)